MRIGRCTVGHPVDVATGSVYSSCTDVSINGRIPLVWERLYSISNDAAGSGPLGPGWNTHYFSTLTRNNGVFRFSNGDYTEAFSDAESTIDRGNILRNFSSCLELTKHGKDYIVTNWNFETPYIKRYRFASGDDSTILLLQTIEDGDGNALELHYDRNGRLYCIRQRRELRTLFLEYSPRHHIKSISLGLPNEERHLLVRYEYDHNDRLIASFDVSGSVERYEYDVSGRLTRETLKCGGDYYFRYDDQGRCVETSGSENYNKKTLRFLDHYRTTEISDSLGNVWRYRWNEIGQVVAEFSPLGAGRFTKYDEFARVIATVDAYGRETSFGYDQQGNRVQVLHPNGAKTVSAFDDRHRLVAITDPLGATWQYEYDPLTERLCEITYPTGVKWYQRWNDAGDLLTIENSERGQWLFFYDAVGQVTTVSDWSGAKYSYKYDHRGNIIEMTDPEGAGTHYKYDIGGRLIQVDYPDNSTHVNTYDSRGNFVRIVESDSAVTTYEYGPDCTHVKVIRGPGGRSVEYIWSTEPGRLLALVDQKGDRHSFFYNEDGYLIKEVFPNGRTISYVRDSCGFVIQRINGAGELTIYERDAVGRINSVTFCDGSQAFFEYDNIGLVVKARNAEAVVEIERNLLGDRVVERCGAFCVESEYDKLGNRISRKSSLGAVTTYQYDPRGTLVEIGLSPSCHVRRKLDRRGREVALRFASIEVRSAYDAMGRLQERSIARTSSVPEARLDSPPGHRRFVYNTLGNLQELWDSKWGTSVFRYDDAGHVIESSSRDGFIERFRYDAGGNIDWFESVTPVVPPGRQGGISTSGNREIGLGNQVVKDRDTRYEYDGDGRLVRKTESYGSGNPRVWIYNWNPMGLLAGVVSPTGDVWRYTYDAFGRRIRKIGPDTDIRYVWDGNAVLHELPHNERSAVVTWTFWPDNFAPVAKQKRGKTYFAINDHLGTPREFVSEDGHVVWSARFKVWGGVKSLSISDIESHLRYQGQWFDPETGLHYNGCRYYSPEIGAFISMDPIPLAGGLNGYQYAINPLNWIDPHGVAAQPGPLDSQGRPTGASGTLTRRDLRPTDSSPPSIDPPGWQGGTHPHHQQRSHVVADTLGGSGDDPRNIIALTDGANHPGMSTAEATVRRHLQQHGGPVHYEVEVNYRDNHKTPSSVHIRATDKHGNVIVDERIVNGRRQKTACCP